MKGAVRLATLLVCVTSAAACAGGSGTKTEGKTATTVSTTSETALKTTKQLAAGLLAPTDLGKGWSEVAIEALGGDLCGVVPLKAAGTTKARSEFVRVVDSELVQDGLTAYPTGGAAAAFAALRAATDGCKSYPVSVKNSATGTSQQFTVGVDAVPLPAVGDERLGLRLAVRDAGGKPQRTLYAVIRRGDVIAALTVTGVEPDRKLFDRVLPIIDERLGKLATP